MMGRRFTTTQITSILKETDAGRTPDSRGDLPLPWYQRD